MNKERKTLTGVLRPADVHGWSNYPTKQHPTQRDMIMDSWNDTPSDTNPEPDARCSNCGSMGCTCNTVISPTSTYPDSNPKAILGNAKTGYRFALIPSALAEMSKSLDGGAEKYGEMNWRTTGVRGSVYLDAMMRHLLAWKEGEDLDPETGANHLGHVMGNCAILMDAAYEGCLLDDRLGKDVDA